MRPRRAPSGGSVADAPPFRRLTGGGDAVAPRPPPPAPSPPASPETRAGAWSKWFLKPMLWGAATTGMLGAIRDLEVRQKLSLFVRSRWFRPPLGGRIMSSLMYDAIIAMGPPKNPTASLLPSDHTLDLFVTLTDYYGYHQLVQIHDPPLIHELDHHHVLKFTYRRRPNGALHGGEPGQ